MGEQHEFTQDWFESLAKSNFETNIKPMFRDKPVNYLEIGCFEGNSVLYMFENVLTHSGSRVTIIDPFEGSTTHKIQLEKFKKNLKKYLDRITIIQGYSNVELQKLEKESYDLIYIDGDHMAYAVLTDGILSFPLLKKGGVMVFDDYKWLNPCVFPDLNHPANPFNGINYFLDTFKGQYKVIDINYQMTIQKF